jgi:hypothetical protein
MISSINLEYLEPYFQKEPQIEPFIDEEIRRYEKERADRGRQENGSFEISLASGTNLGRRRRLPKIG